VLVVDVTIGVGMVVAMPTEQKPQDKSHSPARTHVGQNMGSHRPSKGGSQVKHAKVASSHQASGRRFSLTQVSSRAPPVVVKVMVLASIPSSVVVEDVSAERSSLAELVLVDDAAALVMLVVAPVAS